MIYIYLGICTIITLTIIKKFSRTNSTDIILKSMLSDCDDLQKRSTDLQKRTTDDLDDLQKRSTDGLDVLSKQLDNIGEQLAIHQAGVTRLKPDNAL